MENKNYIMTSFLGLGIRLFLYCTLVWSTTLIIWMDAPEIKEGCLTEQAQAHFLVITALLYIWSAVKSRKNRPTITLMTGMTVLCIIREYDWFFENLDPYFGSTWPTLMIICFFATLVLVFLQRKQLKESLHDFINLHSFGILVSGFFMVYVFSRVLGFRSFWQSVMGVNYVPFVRRFVEEGAELFGYTLFLVAAIEYLLICIKRARQNPS